MKKFKDLTIGEIVQICNSKDCNDCPLSECEYCEFAMLISKNDLEQEIDVPEVTSK